MATITKTKTWSFAEANEPTAANANANFDTLYAALTTGGQVSHTDGSQAFTSLAILPDGEYPADDSDAVSADHAWQKQLEFITGTACWLHGGTHAFPTVSSLYIVSGSWVLTPDGFGQCDLTFNTAFPTDILTAIVDFGATGGTGFQVLQLSLDRAASTLAKLKVQTGNTGADVRINATIVGW